MSSSTPNNQTPTPPSYERDPYSRKLEQDHEDDPYRAEIAQEWLDTMQHAPEYTPEYAASSSQDMSETLERTIERPGSANPITMLATPTTTETVTRTEPSTNTHALNYTSDAAAQGVTLENIKTGIEETYGSQGIEALASSAAALAVTNAAIHKTSDIIHDQKAVAEEGSRAKDEADQEDAESTLKATQLTAIAIKKAYENATIATACHDLNYANLFTTGAEAKASELYQLAAECRNSAKDADSDFAAILNQTATQALDMVKAAQETDNAARDELAAQTTQAPTQRSDESLTTPEPQSPEIDTETKNILLKYNIDDAKIASYQKATGTTEPKDDDEADSEAGQTFQQPKNEKKDAA
ncbi:hypothetical protein IKF15_04200 [Candidatus Saccharibacteria bacterium]|nr:hypothetical protein [Candidatus Saccharibacteria bacterium]